MQRVQQPLSTHSLNLHRRGRLALLRAGDLATPPHELVDELLALLALLAQVRKVLRKSSRGFEPETQDATDLVLAVDPLCDAERAEGRYGLGLGVRRPDPDEDAPGRHEALCGVV